MKFTDHSDLAGQHAFLSASKHAWTNYDEEKIVTSYSRYLAVQRGTVLHKFAKDCIDLRQKLPKVKKTLNMFVNDALGFRMKTEQVLFYSFNAFGTADAISFRDEILRIHDLKTGVTPTSMNQLMVYASLFCLEYEIDPVDIDAELRIYHTDDILVLIPDPKDIRALMDKIVLFDKKIQQIKSEQEE